MIAAETYEYNAAYHTVPELEQAALALNFERSSANENELFAEKQTEAEAKQSKVNSQLLAARRRVPLTSSYVSGYGCQIASHISSFCTCSYYNSLWLFDTTLLDNRQVKPVLSVKVAAWTTIYFFTSYYLFLCSPG